MSWIFKDLETKTPKPTRQIETTKSVCLCVFGVLTCFCLAMVPMNNRNHKNIRPRYRKHTKQHEDHTTPVRDCWISTVSVRSDHTKTTQMVNETIPNTSHDTNNLDPKTTHRIHVKKRL